MIRFKVTNPGVTTDERTFLTADYSTGTTLTVRNSEGFTIGWYVVVGEPGQEQSETVRVTAKPTSATITISAALNFSHPKSTPVYASHFNQIAVERQATGGVYAAATGSPFDIGWDNSDNKTIISVSDGETTDNYKWRFYNSNSTDYSTYSDVLAGTGLDRYTIGHVIQQVKRNPIARNIDENAMIAYGNDYQALIYEEMPKAWWFTREGTAISTAASTYTYSISDNWSDLLSIKYLLYEYISGDSIDETYPLSFTTDSIMYNLKTDANQSDDDHVNRWSLYPPDDDSAKGYVALHPTPETADCYIKPVYEIELTNMDSFGDTLVIPNPKGYTDYILYRIYDDIKSDSANATNYNARVGRSIIALKRRSKRQRGQQEFFRYRGQKGWSRMFGEGGRPTGQTAVENYW